MDILQALILGLVEGLTEYLPVSSTGHLLLTQRLMGIESDEISNAFVISIQIGAILAVVGLYRARIGEMLLGAVGRNPGGRRLAFNLAAAFVPAAVLGLILEKIIKKFLFGGGEWGLWPIVAAWFVGGAAILVVAAIRKRLGRSATGSALEGLTLKMSVLIGAAQCLAMWPGVSRSLITIVGGVIAGLSLPAAVEFSFLLGVITLGAATAKDMWDFGGAMLSSYGWLPVAAGFFAAWLSAILAVKWMVGYLNKHGMEIFGWYRVILAIAVTAWLLWPK